MPWKAFTSYLCENCTRICRRNRIVWEAQCQSRFQWQRRYQKTVSVFGIFRASVSAIIKSVSYAITTFSGAAPIKLPAAENKVKELTDKLLETQEFPQCIKILFSKVSDKMARKRAWFPHFFLKFSINKMLWKGTIPPSESPYDLIQVFLFGDSEYQVFLFIMTKFSGGGKYSQDESSSAINGLMHVSQLRIHLAHWKLVLDTHNALWILIYPCSSFTLGVLIFAGTFFANFAFFGHFRESKYPPNISRC